MIKVNILGIAMAAILEILLLALLNKAAGAGLAVLLAILIIAVVDFFFLRSMPIILGQVIGFLSATGIWYLLILVGVVR